MKGPQRRKQTQEQNKKVWASSAGLCQSHKPQHPQHVKVSPRGHRKLQRQLAHIKHIKRITKFTITGRAYEVIISIHMFHTIDITLSLTHAAFGKPEGRRGSSIGVKTYSDKRRRDQKRIRMNSRRKGENKQKIPRTLCDCTRFESLVISSHHVSLTPQQWYFRCPVCSLLCCNELFVVFIAVDNGLFPRLQVTLKGGGGKQHGTPPPPPSTRQNPQVPGKTTLMRD